MRLDEAIKVYVAAKRASGCVFIGDDRMLRSFARSVGNIALNNVTPALCEMFYRKKSPEDTMEGRKHQCLRCFFEFAATRGYVKQVPMKPAPAKRKSSFRPYIYSRAEVRKLLDSAQDACRVGWFVSGKVLRMLILLLYGAGLRSGEARRLRLRDLDLESSLLTVWDSKFFKSRFVPLGPDLVAALRTYLKDTGANEADAPKDRPLFPTPKGTALSEDVLDRAFRRAARIAGIHKQGSKLDVRLHDLRHSFAVHRLLEWYRSGANVQALLPALSTYMGHLDLRSTQVYLTMTHELLSEASHRFERYAFPSKEVKNA